MNAKDKKTLITAIENTLQIKGLIAAHEVQLDGLKEVIAKICKGNPADFIEGVLAIEGVGAVKIARNKPTLVFADGTLLNEIEKIGFLDAVGAKYQKIDIDVVKVRDAVLADDKKVLKVMRKENLAVIQATRYDVKAEKEEKPKKGATA